MSLWRSTGKRQKCRFGVERVNYTWMNDTNVQTSLDILCDFEAYTYLYICCIFSEHVAKTDIIQELVRQN